MVAINDLRHPSSISEVLRCDGSLRLHMANAKSPIRYLEVSQKLAFSTKIRNGDLQNKQKTRGGNGYSVGPECFYKKEESGRKLPSASWAGGRS